MEFDSNQNLAKLLSSFVNDPTIIKFIIDHKKELENSFSKHNEDWNRWVAGESIPEIQWAWCEVDHVYWENPHYSGPKEENPEIYEKEVREAGKLEVEKQWIKCPRDASHYVENPCYNGDLPQPHPDDLDDDDDGLDVITRLPLQVINVALVTK